MDVSQMQEEEDEQVDAVYDRSPLRQFDHLANEDQLMQEPENNKSLSVDKAEDTQDNKFNLLPINEKQVEELKEENS